MRFPALLTQGSRCFLMAALLTAIAHRFEHPTLPGLVSASHLVTVLQGKRKVLEWGVRHRALLSEECHTLSFAFHVFAFKQSSFRETKRITDCCVLHSASPVVELPAIP